MTKPYMNESCANRQDACFLTWHLQTRSRNLARELHIPIWEKEICGLAVWRHSASALWTVWILARRRPRLVYLQYSYLLLVIVAVYKWVRRRRVVVVCDCHTKALRRTIRGALHVLFWTIKCRSLCAADVVIVSNHRLANEALRLNRHIHVLPDPIPAIELTAEPAPDDDYCVFINSFAADEPAREVLAAAQLLTPDLRLYWTGRVPSSFRHLAMEASNVVFTSYLADDRYFRLIARAACLLVLTTQEDCLVSGAYEGLAVGVPLVLSDTAALHRFFGAAAIYTDHIPQHIAHAIRYAVQHRAAMCYALRQVRDQRQAEFAYALAELQTTIADACVERPTDQRINRLP